MSAERHDTPRLIPVPQPPVVHINYGPADVPDETRRALLNLHQRESALFPKPSVATTQLLNTPVHFTTDQPETMQTLVARIVHQVNLTHGGSLTAMLPDDEAVYGFRVVYLTAYDALVRLGELTGYLFYFDRMWRLRAIKRSGIIE